MKNYFLLLVSLTVFSCSSFFVRNPANTENTVLKPRHVIITVHGLSGNALTWGHFEEVTKDYLPLINPDHEVIISNFVYPTGKNEKLTTFDFANALNAHIENLFKDRPLEPNDRISLVAHSQGGLVSYIWFFSRIFNDQLEQKYIKQVDTIITLGTPFWGSKLASILTDENVPNIVPLVNLISESPITRRELLDMSFGSDVIHSFRKLAIQMDTDPTLKKKIEDLPIRFVNIMGILPKNKKDIFANDNANTVSKFARKMIGFIYDIFQDSSEGRERVESDIAVMIPSGRWDFIYAKPQIIRNDKTRISANEFHNFNNFINKSKFLFTESVHLPFDNDNTLSMAYINKNCTQVETCNHPTYRYVLEQLADCSRFKCDETQRVNIIQKMKTINRGHKDKDNNVVYEHNLYKDISKTLQTFSIQIEMKLKTSQISKFPVRYFTSSSNTIDSTVVWNLQEHGLIGKVIDLKRDKNQMSLISTEDKQIFLGVDKERRSIDIISKEAKVYNDNDIIRMNVVGYVKLKNGGSTDQKTVVPLSINLPDLPRVDIEAVVQPGYSTYIALDYTDPK